MKSDTIDLAKSTRFSEELITVTNLISYRKEDGSSEAVEFKSIVFNKDFSIIFCKEQGYFIVDRNTQRALNNVGFLNDEIDHLALTCIYLSENGRNDNYRFGAKELITASTLASDSIRDGIEVEDQKLIDGFSIFLKNL